MPHDHLQAKASTWRSWRSMLNRCAGHHGDAYANVPVHEGWRKFPQFYADMGDRPEGTTLDRIDGNKGYSPDNCRWATNTEQARNKSNNRMFLHNGKALCLVAWAEELGVCESTLHRRLRKGWPLDKVLRPKSQKSHVTGRGLNRA